MSIVQLVKFEAVPNPLDSLTLTPAPINPATIIEGQPVARSAVLSRSDDMCANTMVWDCTAGRFHWHYDVDETVVIETGEVQVSINGKPDLHLVPGSVAFFAAGTDAVWTVEAYVRKVAFCRVAMPPVISIQCRLYNKIMRTLQRGKARSSL